MEQQERLAARINQVDGLLSHPNATPQQRARLEVLRANLEALSAPAPGSNTSPPASPLSATAQG